MLETIQAWIGEYGAFGIFLAMMLGIVGLPVPDETILVFCGYMISQGKMSLATTLTGGILGSFSGITLSYLLGRTFGYPLLHKYGRWIHVSDEMLARIHRWFGKMGAWTLTFGYYIAGVRHFTAFVAGASKLEFHRFAAFAYSGAILWVVTFVLLGNYLGENWITVWETAHRHLHIASAVFLAVVVILILIKWRQTKKKWQRG
jgi:membrane protein DedA with SNARE-associated domain